MSEERLPRVYTNQPLAANTEIELQPSATKHLQQVLRLRRGDHFIVFDGHGHDFAAEIKDLRGTNLIACVGAAGPPEPAPALRIHLGIGVSKGERMEFAIQKAVEVGVTELTPLWTGRSVVKLDGERLARKITRWQGIIISACEQSGRRVLPRLHQPVKLADWLAHDHPCGVLLDHRAEATLHQLPPPVPNQTGNQITLAIGPEGGLSPEERATAMAKRFTPVRLGPRILRTETAPLAAIAAIQTLWGDFRDIPDTE
ncbi:16S rRNA (uracil(1498)-N(3))-methyltransferase [Thiorhodovibrio frisius]|uniref:Ribosomal RNA small subunit methyltransferase E n=1 Tax=Thiorhodovibrio frisius TaxID=631362 RepID=H8YVN2_9GAMM|nr:16S rRNA (uracil(1498)-N(3))-methyltransferase [Thiorhodovibrio frisius]EIC23972.1 RNA methyltransferase, RsmE family [Thiorhodovibrio frisius]WPL23045.1 Ribosomal RNA small subunit methyltransferase E [Thiorhodovibrio frisius]